MSTHPMQFIYDKSGLILDLDNTIAKLKLLSILSQPNIVGKLIQLKSVSDRFRGLRLNHLNEELAQAMGISLIELDKLAAKAYRKASVSQTVNKLIEQWDSTGKPRSVVSDHCGIDKLKAIGLHHGWSAIINCRHHNAFKPLPDGLWAAAAHMGLPPSEMVFIGDRLDTDGLAAYEFGCHFVDIRDL